MKNGRPARSMFFGDIRTRFWFTQKVIGIGPHRASCGRANWLQDKTLKPLFQSLDVEIEEKSMPHTGQFQIRKQLRIVDAGETLHTFESENELMSPQTQRCRTCPHTNER